VALTCLDARPPAAIAYLEALGDEAELGPLPSRSSNFTDLEVGQHVVLSYSSCGRCRFCVTGEPTYCEQVWAPNTPCCRPDGTTALADDSDAVFGPVPGQS